VKVKRLDHFGADVADLGRAERFYAEVLGMSVQLRLADQVLMRGGETICALFLKPDRAPSDPEHVRNPLGKSHHAFEVAWEDLKAAQAPIDWGDHDCLYFLDPDGNLLELVGYRSNGTRT